MDSIREDRRGISSRGRPAAHRKRRDIGRLAWTRRKNSRGHRAVSRRARDSPKDTSAFRWAAALVRTNDAPALKTFREAIAARGDSEPAAGARQRFAGANGNMSGYDALAILE